MSQNPSSTNDTTTTTTPASRRRRPPAGTPTETTETTAPGFRPIPEVRPPVIDHPNDPTILDAGPSMPDLGGAGDGAETVLSGMIGGPSQASTAEVAGGLAEITAKLLQLVGVLVHRVRRRPVLFVSTPDGIAAVPVWVPDDGQAAAIAEPLSRIAARRVPAGAGASSDLWDAGEAALATVGFVIGELDEETTARAQAAPVADAGA